MTLVELVQQARKALAGRELQDWHMECFEWDRTTAQYCWQIAEEVAEDVVRLCFAGHYRIAAQLAFPRDTLIDAENWDVIVGLDECPEWVRFREVVQVAERIDDALAGLERRGEVREVARDCRNNLDLLAVLADCCEDHGFPRAAAEVRHLAGLVRGCR